MDHRRVDALRRVEVLKELSPASLERVACSCDWLQASAGQAIYETDAAPAAVYLLLSGKVRVLLYSCEGKPVLFNILSSGDLFGGIAVIDGRRRFARAEAAEDCALAVLPAPEFLRLLKDEPGFALLYLKRVCGYARQLAERVFDLNTLAVRDRIQAEILRLARRTGGDDDEVLIMPFPPLRELASGVGTAREAASREISHLVEIGLVHREPGGLRVLSVARLSELVREARGE